MFVFDGSLFSDGFSSSSFAGVTKVFKNVYMIDTEVEIDIPILQQGKKLISVSMKLRRENPFYLRFWGTLSVRQNILTVAGLTHVFDL